jgi:hypothetical protein
MKENYKPEISGRTEREDRKDSKVYIYVEQEILKGPFLSVPIEGLTVNQTSGLFDAIAAYMESIGAKNETTVISEDLPTHIKHLEVHNNFTNIWMAQFDHRRERATNWGFTKNSIREALSEFIEIGPGQIANEVDGKFVTCLMRIRTLQKVKVQPKPKTKRAKIKK